MLHKLQLSELNALVAFTQILTSPSYQKSSNWQRTAIPMRSSGSVSSGDVSGPYGELFHKQLSTTAVFFNSLTCSAISHCGLYNQCEPTHNSHHLKRIIFYEVVWWDRFKQVQCKLQCIAIRLSLGFTPNSWWLLVPSSLLLAILSANRIHMEKPIQWLLCSVSFWYIWRF